MLVYEDPSGEQEPIRSYIALTGHVGDVPQTAISAAVCSHAAVKGCRACFILGSTCTRDGKTLKPPKFGGYAAEGLAQAETFVIEEDEGGIMNAKWSKEDVQYLQADGTFNLDLAEKLRVSDTQNAQRAGNAARIADDAKRDYPTPERLPGERAAEFAKRMILT